MAEVFHRSLFLQGPAGLTGSHIVDSCFREA